MDRFSIIVPLQGDEACFDETLASVLRSRPEGCQIIVVHDENYDDPYDLAKEVDFVTAPSRANLIASFNRGLAMARGELVGLLRPGVELPESWDDWIIEAFDDLEVGSVAPALTSCGEPNRLVTGGVALTWTGSRSLIGCGKKNRARSISKKRLLGPTSWAGFYRRSLLVSLGEGDEDLDPHYFDVDLGMSLKYLGFRAVFCPECVVTMEEPSVVLEEARRPHGKSAQRFMHRHCELSGGELARRTGLAVLSEVVSAPFRPSKLVHAIGRMRAGRYRDSDELHRNLLSALLGQRQRLIETSLRLHEESTESLSHAGSRFGATRKAA